MHRARLARLGIHPAHPRPPPAGLPAVSSRGIAHNCKKAKRKRGWVYLNDWGWDPTDG